MEKSPFLPYIVFDNILTGLWGSMAVTPVALLLTGNVKSGFAGISLWRGSGQTVFVGGLAAAAVFGIARLSG